MTIRTRAEKDAATRRAKKIALGVGVAMAAIHALTLIGMLTRVLPLEQRTPLLPAGWAGLYQALTAPGGFLTMTISFAFTEQLRWLWLGVWVVLNGVAWYVIARAAIWIAAEILPARSPRRG